MRTLAFTVWPAGYLLVGSRVWRLGWLERAAASCSRRIQFRVIHFTYDRVTIKLRPASWLNRLNLDAYLSVLLQSGKDFRMKEQRHLPAMRIYIESLLSTGWVIAGRSPLKLRSGHNSCVVRNGMLISESLFDLAS